jgi:hypothetical protein
MGKDKRDPPFIGVVVIIRTASVDVNNDDIRKDVGIGIGKINGIEQINL